MTTAQSCASAASSPTGDRRGMGSEPFTLADTESARVAAERLFASVRETLAELLPPTADIRHVGATAVPGCLTKGDLDIVVRVPANDFAAADAVLASRFARNGGSIRTDTFSAFEDGSSQPHLGVQLAVITGRSTTSIASPKRFGSGPSLSRHTTRSSAHTTAPTWRGIEPPKLPLSSGRWSACPKKSRRRSWPRGPAAVSRRRSRNQAWRCARWPRGESRRQPACDEHWRARA